MIRSFRRRKDGPGERILDTLEEFYGAIREIIEKTIAVVKLR